MWFSLKFIKIVASLVRDLEQFRFEWGEHDSTTLKHKLDDKFNFIGFCGWPKQDEAEPEKQLHY
jgi:hypothetical protein